MNENTLKSELARAYRADTTGFTMFDFIHAFGSPLQALMYSYLFSPTFVVFEDMVFLQDVLEDKHDRDRVLTMLERGESREAVEKALNTIEIASLFGRHAGDTTDDGDEFLAARLAATWRCHLLHVFPNRRLEVEVTTSDDPVAIVFFQTAFPGGP